MKYLLTSTLSLHVSSSTIKVPSLLTLNRLHKAILLHKLKNDTFHLLVLYFTGKLEKSPSSQVHSPMLRTRRQWLCFHGGFSAIDLPHPSRLWLHLRVQIYSLTIMQCPLIRFVIGMLNIQAGHHLDALRH